MTSYMVGYLAEILATSWEVTDSIPDEVTGFLSLPNPSNYTMALGATQL
jgi:hypothetical protein